MIAIVLAALIMNGTTGPDTLSTKKMAENYKIFYHPPAVLISPQNDQLPEFIPVPIFLNDAKSWQFNEGTGSAAAKNGTDNVKRSRDGSRQKK